MAKLSIDQKIRRTAQFLAGLRSPRIAAQLVRFGFTSEVRREGWDLVARAGGANLDLGTPTRSAALDDGALVALDAFENRWFPITRATLRRHAPDALETIFHNLRQTDGLDVVLSVGTFLRRVRQADPSVLQILASRGLDEAELARGEALLAAGTVKPPIQEEDAILEAQKAADEAVDAMWAWYLEWSAIARTVIQNAAQRRALGFGKRRSGAAVSDQPPAEPTPTAPAPAEPAEPAEPAPTDG